MYLTKLKCVANHRMVMAGFPDSDIQTPRSEWGVLFRVDGAYTLVQSHVMPDYSRILPSDKYLTREYQIDVVAKREYRFRLAINAVARVKGSDVFITPEEWFNRRADEFGFVLGEWTATHDPVTESSSGHRVQVNRYQVDGMLTVTNPEIVINQMISGYGRGKSWGCGMMSLLPTHSTIKNAVS